MLQVIVRLPDLERLADAEDRRDAVAVGGPHLRVHRGVVLVVVLAALGVPDHDVGAAELREHRARDVAGVGAGVVWGEVLCAVTDRHAVAVDQRLHAADVDEGRQHRDLDALRLLGVQAERQLLHEADRLEVVVVHLPVAGDQRPASVRELGRGGGPRHVSALPERRHPAAPCPRGTRATHRRRSRCARMTTRPARAGAPRRPSRRPPTTDSPPDPEPAAATARATPSVPAANGATSNTPIGPFQNTVRAPSSAAAKAATESGPMSRPLPPSGIASTGTIWVGASGAMSQATTTSVGSTILSPRLVEQPPAGVDLVLLQQRVADRMALGRQEGEAHPAADEQPVDPGQQRVDDRELVADLRAAEHDDVGPLRFAGQGAQHVELLDDEARRRSAAAASRCRTPRRACGAPHRTRSRRTRRRPPHRR